MAEEVIRYLGKSRVREERLLSSSTAQPKTNVSEAKVLEEIAATTEESEQLEIELFAEPLPRKSRINLARDVPLYGTGVEAFIGGEPSLSKTAVVVGSATLVLSGAKALKYFFEREGKSLRRVRSAVIDEENNLYLSRLDYALRKAREEAGAEGMKREIIQGNPLGGILQLFTVPSRFLALLQESAERTTPLLDYAAEHPDLRFVGQYSKPTTTPGQ